MSNKSGDNGLGSGSTCLFGDVGVVGDVGAKSDTDSILYGECVASSFTFDVNVFPSLLGDDGGPACTLLVILVIGCLSRSGVNGGAGDRPCACSGLSGASIVCRFSLVGDARPTCGEGSSVCDTDSCGGCLSIFLFFSDDTNGFFRGEAAGFGSLFFRGDDAGGAGAPVMVGLFFFGDAIRIASRSFD